MKEINSNILSDITVHMKYAKYIPELQRRETWKELVDRNMAMHIKKYPELEVEIRKAYSYVFTKQILPSMRSLQFAGKPIEISPNRLYNCSYLPVDDPKAFDEAMYILMCGTGVGFSVERECINKLPEGPALFFGNEFFDAIPVKQYEKINNKLYEHCVCLDEKNNIKKRLIKASA